MVFKNEPSSRGSIKTSYQEIEDRSIEPPSSMFEEINHAESGHREHVALCAKQRKCNGERNNRAQGISDDDIWFDATQSRKGRHHTGSGRCGRQSSLQPTARPDHECHRVLQTDGSTGHRGSLPAGLDRASQWPISSAALAFVARVCWQLSIVRAGSRPSGCPRPMRRGWLRRNRLDHNPPAHHSLVREGLASASVPRCFYFQALHTLPPPAKSKPSPFLR